MLIRLVLLFTVVPLVELAILIRVGMSIGLLPTLLIVIATGAIGAALARAEGFHVLYRVRDCMERGELPTIPLLDGALILAAGLLLITPGILTDAAGFLLLVPVTRSWIRERILRRLRAMLAQGEERVIRIN